MWLLAVQEALRRSGATAWLRAAVSGASYPRTRVAGTRVQVRLDSDQCPVCLCELDAGCVLWPAGCGHRLHLQCMAALRDAARPM
eukprot:2962630-Alexandrium_andersonii.AAC.1